MTEQDREHAAPPADRPVPDLGFFAGAPQPRDGSAFGGSGVGAAPPARGGQFGQFGQFGTAPGNPFGSAATAPTGQFGGAPTGQFGAPTGQFGAPTDQVGNPTSPFGVPAPALPGPLGPPPGARGGLGTTAKLVVAGVAVVVLLVAVLGGRFAWTQFVADPVLPDTLGGMPMAPGTDTDLSAMQQNVTDELAAGGMAKVGLYTDGQGSGYVLVAVRGGSRDTDSGSGADPLASWTKSEQGGTTCYSQPAQAAAGFGVTLCMQGFWRRAVLVMGMALTPPDPAVVAQVTEEAWDAQ